MEEMLTESRIAEEKAKKAMIDAARIADELRSEQENAQMAESNRRVLDIQVKAMQTKLDEAEQLAVKGGKKVDSRLEQKITCSRMVTTDICHWDGINHEAAKEDLPGKRHLYKVNNFQSGQLGLKLGQACAISSLLAGSRSLSAMFMLLAWSSMVRAVGAYQCTGEYYPTR